MSRQSGLHKEVLVKKMPFRISVAISIVLLIVAVALFAIARQNPGDFTPLNSSKVARSDLLDNLFTQANGSACPAPCMFGVTSGKTSYTGVAALLRSHPYFSAHFLANEDRPGVYRATTGDLLLTFYDGSGGV